MTSYSIFNDFCSWWAFWWVLPFLLGLLLGRILWGGYKRKLRVNEEVLTREQNYNYDLQKNLKKCTAERERLNGLVAELEKKNGILAKKSPASIAGLHTAGSSAAIKSKSSPKQKAAVIPHDSLSKSGHKKGNYKTLQKSNLQIIEGIGPKMESLLKENGITNWKELSNKSVGELRAILDKYGGRYSIVNPDSWPKQARLAANQKFKKLIDFQSEDNSDSKLNKILVRLGIH